MTRIEWLPQGSGFYDPVQENWQLIIPLFVENMWILLEYFTHLEAFYIEMISVFQ
jgi:hypothetical protein